MKIRDLFHMSIGSLFKRKVRSILTISGVVIGTAAVVLMLGLGIAMDKAFMEMVEQYGGLTTITVNVSENFVGRSSGSGAIAISVDDNDSPSSNEPKYLTDELVSTFEQMEHVKSVDPILTTSALAFSGKYETNLNITGIDLEALKRQNIGFAQGALPAPTDTGFKLIFGNLVLANFYDPRSGGNMWSELGELPDIDLMNDPIFLILDTERYYEHKMGADEDGKITPKPKKRLADVAGVIEGSTDPMEGYGVHAYETYCDIDELKAVLKKEFKGRAIPGQPTTKSGKPFKDIFYSSIMVNVDDMNNVMTVQNQIKEMGYSAYSNIEWIEMQQEQSRLLQLILGGIGSISLLIAAIGIANTMMMSIYERTKEIGILKVLGCNMKDIQALFLLEAGFIGFIGGIVGVGLSYIVSIILNLTVGSMGGVEMSSGLVYIPPWLAVLAIIFAVLVGVLSGLFPSLRAMRLSPLAAIRNE